jgi:hypothetical protein
VVRLLGGVIQVREDQEVREIPQAQGEAGVYKPYRIKAFTFSHLDAANVALSSSKAKIRASIGFISKKPFTQSKAAV